MVSSAPTPGVAPSSAKPSHLALFDIDGTLLRAGRQVGRFFLEAMKEVYGTWGDASGYDFGGKTDPRIIVDLLVADGWEADRVRELMPAVRDRYLPALAEGLDAGQMEELPGVRPLLDRWSHSDRVGLGLVTGNWRQGAFTKLERLGLHSYFAFGAYGDDSEDRRRLPPVAVERAGAVFSRSFPARNVLIIGDTVHDVDCARHHDIPVLAVATGRTSRSRLEAAGATWVVDDLESPVARGVLDGWLA